MKNHKKNHKNKRFIERFTKKCTERLYYKLRKFKESDADSLAKYANNPKIAKFLTHEFPSPYSKEDAKEFIYKIASEKPTKTFTISVNNESSGAIALTPTSIPDQSLKSANLEQNNTVPDNFDEFDEFDEIAKVAKVAKVAEIGYWLAEDYWNKGIVTNCIKDMVCYGFETFNINRIFATPFVENKASQKVLKKAGFNLESESKQIILKNSHYYEVLMFSISREDFIRAFIQPDK